MKKKYNTLIQLLESKASVKQDVYAHSKRIFEEFKVTSTRIVHELSLIYQEKDDRVSITLKDVSPFEFRIRLGGDVLVFHMHSNVFQYPRNHPYWNLPYFKDDPTRSYGGIIHVYNFLNDSLQYNRENDLGFMIARVFVNKESHFAVEGAGKINTHFRKIHQQRFDPASQEKLVKDLMQFALTFELYVPRYRATETVSVKQAQEFKRRIKIKTAKRLGFDFGGRN